MNIVAFPIREIRDDNLLISRVNQLTDDLRTLTNEGRTLRQLLESTLSEAQRSVFHDIEAKAILRDRKAFELEMHMRKLVQGP